MYLLSSYIKLSKHIMSKSVFGERIPYKAHSNLQVLMRVYKFSFCVLYNVPSGYKIMFDWCSLDSSRETQFLSVNPKYLYKSMKYGYHYIKS